MPPRKSPRPVKNADATGATGLRLSEPAERLRAAQVQHELLLAKVARRRVTLDTVEREAREATTRVASRVAPKVVEVRAFDAELHALFEALITDRARPARDRAAVQRCYFDLQRRGILSPRPTTDAARRGAARPEPEDLPPFDEDLGDGVGDGRGEAASAARPKDSEHGLLRAAFRRLVEAFHPDKVQDEREKHQRTEIMKEITEAYRRGDFARLLELERRWLRDHPEDLDRWTRDDPGAESSGELERRYLAVERANDELREQLRELEREVRAVRKSPHGSLARTLKRARRDGLDESNLDIVRELEAAAAELRTLRDFVAAFRDRKMSLAAFLHGPTSGRKDQDDYDDFLDAVTELAQQMMRAERSRMQRQQPAPPRPRGRGRRG